MAARAAVAAREAASRCMWPRALCFAPSLYCNAARSSDHLACAAAREQRCVPRPARLTPRSKRARASPASLSQNRPPSLTMFASIALKPLPVLPARKAASRGAACRASPVVRASVQRPAKVSLQATCCAAAPAADACSHCQRRCWASARPWAAARHAAALRSYRPLCPYRRSAVRGRASGRRLQRTRRRWCTADRPATRTRDTRRCAARRPDLKGGSLTAAARRLRPALRCWPLRSPCR